MAPVKQLRFLLVFVLSGTTLFALVSGLALLPSSQDPQQRADHEGEHAEKRTSLVASVQEPIGKWIQNTFNPSSETSSEGVAIVDWKSYVDASRFNYALNHWESLKNNQEMINRYGVHGPSPEGMPKVLCLVDSSASDSEGQTIETSGCTWEEVHDPKPSQRWHIRYKYLGDDNKSSDRSPRWVATMKNGRTDKCTEATYDTKRTPIWSRRNTNTPEVFKVGRVVSSSCHSAPEESKKGIEFTIKRCANSQTPSDSGVDETDEIFRNWSLCIYPSYESPAYTTEDEKSPQNTCSDPSGQGNLVHALDKPSSVGWGCGPNTWYFPTQALSIENGNEWKQL
ncbi:hypothetical protein TWF679_004157 [Orbilia oligospora]|uniref:Uncharacterized protein n=1 Tax=Orbilia oligospora TaxID=2813651 RepID=A0A8H8VM43_ORBOL|nr:hypothetical protein TWF679_004157 [Orbilia oligospora]